MKRTTLLIASTAIALAAGPLFAEAHVVNYDAANTLEGKAANVETMRAMNGGSVYSSDGVLLGSIENFSIEDSTHAEITFDPDGETRYNGSRVILTAGLENMTAMNGNVALSVTADELYAKQGTGSGDVVKIDF